MVFAEQAYKTRVDILHGEKGQIQQPQYIIEGTVVPGFEAVRDMFAQHFEDGCEDKAQVCAYVKGVKVVELWGEQVAKVEAASVDYGQDGLQNIFSSGKSLTALVIAMLVDRGHLSYDQPISAIWPEFSSDDGKYSKQKITVAELMRHEAGMYHFSTPIKITELTTESIQSGNVSRIIEQQHPAHEPGSKRHYHAITRGWIANEIVRRADPQHRTIATFVAQEIAAPLGLEKELSVGAPEALWHKVAPVQAPHLWWTWAQMLLPRAMGGGKLPVSSKVMQAMVVALAPVLATADMFMSSSLFNKIGNSNSKASGSIDFSSAEEGEVAHDSTSNSAKDQSSVLASAMNQMNSPAWRRAEIPSANVHASARALAKVAAVIVEGGAICRNDAAHAQTEACSEQRIISKEGIRTANADAVSKVTTGIARSRTTYFSNAGWTAYKNMQDGCGREGYVGWMGAGGSAFQWHPEQRIGFGYAMNQMELTPSNERAAALQKVVLDCAVKHAAGM